ncbi:hypothetical protein [Leuconostoc citreum]|uniref:hypothetical protein n=1 Tax=Leuconostoc citreum TaxID=33964 RepID=UPI00024664C9|nr:hypothetical protein [Leuconostoc citreum]CCF26282.1 Protein of unknown function [Leuconostoc citreum LBAE C11]
MEVGDEKQINNKFQDGLLSFIIGIMGSLLVIFLYLMWAKKVTDWGSVASWISGFGTVAALTVNIWIQYDLNKTKLFVDCNLRTTKDTNDKDKTKEIEYIINAINNSKRSVTIIDSGFILNKDSIRSKHAKVPRIKANFPLDDKRITIPFCEEYTESIDGVRLLSILNFFRLDRLDMITVVPYVQDNLHNHFFGEEVTIDVKRLKELPLIF